MEYRKLLELRRTVRLFKPVPVADELLASLVDAARVASCASNKQRLRYMVVRSPELVLEVLKHTRWAGLVQPHRTPQPGISSPAAFIVQTTTEGELSELLCADAGAAIQSIEFAACDVGLGCCWLGAIDREAIEELLGCGKIVYLAAVGYPAENPRAVEVSGDESIAYYLDKDGVLTVPKFRLQDILKWK